MAKTGSIAIKSLAIGILLFAINGCVENKSNSKFDSNKSTEAITKLEKRVADLELQLGKRVSDYQNDQNKAPQGPIKSLTFRLGTKDDRLRIYWADGSNSDLPCTKEQSIWVCG